MDKSSSLISLQPAKAENENVLRVFSRLKAAEHLDFDAKCPMILHSKHPLTELIVRDYHINVLKHVGGVNTTLSEINKKFWIVGGRILIKKILRECVLCRRRLAKPLNQIMAPLPDFRISEGAERLEAFSSVGIDCAGPFVIKARRGRLAGGQSRKRWMLLFRCALYGAIHIEKVNSMDNLVF